MATKYETEQSYLREENLELVECRESLLKTLAKLKAKAKKYDDSKYNEGVGDNQINLLLADLDDLRIRNDKLNVAFDLKAKENLRLRENLSKKIFNGGRIPGDKKEAVEKAGKENEPGPVKTL